MEKDFLKKDTDTVAESATASVQNTVKDTVDAVPTENSVPAFEYQPPVVETPEPPTVSDMPSVENVPQAAQPVQASQPQFQQQQYQPQFQQPQYQQPQYQQPQYQQQQYQQQQFQQPQFQQPQYQQPQYQQQQYQQPGVSSQPYYQYAPVNPALVSRQNTTDGFAVASLICAIVGLISCCTVVPSLLGIVFGAISKAKNDGTRPTGVSTAGLIIGIIGLILNILVVLGMIFAD